MWRIGGKIGVRFEDEPLKVAEALKTHLERVCEEQRCAIELDPPPSTEPVRATAYN